MKKYYVNFSRGFANEHTVVWTEGNELDSRWDRISRKEAIKMCIAERRARRDGAGGYASINILPYGDPYTETPKWDGYETTDGYVYE